MSTITGVNVYTYTVAVAGEDRIKKTDQAIAIYLRNNPFTSVDDALDALFEIGVNAYICQAFPAHKEYELKHGQALVITGSQGCGKTTLARKIAAQHGTFAEIGAHELETCFGLSRALASEPDTLIVEGFPTNVKTISEIKAAITNDTVIYHRQCQEPKEVKAPNFIFCTDEYSLPHFFASRRFFVINLGTPKETIHFNTHTANEVCL